VIPVLAALLVAAAVGLAVPLVGRVAPGYDTEISATASDERPLLLRFRVVLTGLGVVGGWVVVGGAFGLGAGLLAGAVSWRVLTRLESPGAVRRRRELLRDVPVAVQLMAACLAAGAATSAALQSVSDAMPGAMGDELSLIRRRLDWGMDPANVWRSLDGPLGELGRRMARAHESGASVQHAVARLADDLRSENRARADNRARTVEVRAAAPLGLCFLPCFVLLGVIPLAVGLFSSLSLFR